MIPTIQIKSNDFKDSWYLLNKTIMKDGYEIWSDETEAKLTKDVCATIELTGNAIKQIEEHELHQDYPMWSGLDSYLQQFVYGSEEYERSNDEQDYTYAGRMLIDAEVIQQDKLLRKYDRGCQLTTWNKFRDLGNHTRPCLQRMWIRKLSDTECELHTTYRSHDVYAWMFNNIATYEYAKRYIVGDKQIVKIVEFNDSLHIYDYDWDRAKRVRKPTRNMRLSYE
jgi:thymidylate synthase